MLARFRRCGQPEFRYPQFAETSRAEIKANRPTNKTDGTGLAGLVSRNPALQLPEGCRRTYVRGTSGRGSLSLARARAPNRRPSNYSTTDRSRIYTPVLGGEGDVRRGLAGPVVTRFHRYCEGRVCGIVRLTWPNDKQLSRSHGWDGAPTLRDSSTLRRPCADRLHGS